MDYPCGFKSRSSHHSGGKVCLVALFGRSDGTAPGDNETMETELLDKTTVQARFRITIPADEVSRTYRSVLNTLSRQIRVPGFRPGKAPRGVLIRRIGEEALGNEVREALVDASYPKAVKELELSAIHAHFDAGPPAEGRSYVFEVEVDLYPTLELPDLREITIDSGTRTITDEEFDQAAEQLATLNATLVPAERPIDPKNYVLVESLTGDGSGSTLPIDLERASDELVEQLLGRSIGDELDLTLRSSDEAEGKMTLRVKVIDVKEKELPELDDDFAKTLGLESWAAAAVQIREGIQAQADEEAFEMQREEFVEKLVAETPFEIPHSLISRRKVRLLEGLAEDLARRNLTLEGYLDSLKEDGKREEFDQNLTERAESGVRRDLVLEKLHESVGKEIDDKEFDQTLQHLAAQERKDVARFKRDRGEAWLVNYRFLMARNRTLNDVVKEKVDARSSIVTE